jgi:voltage-gated potassium channel
MSRTNPVEDFNELPNKFKLFFWLILLLFGFGTIAFSLILKISFLDGFIYTLESLAFIFHEGNIIIYYFEIFLALFGVFMVWWILWNIFDIIFTAQFLDFIFSKITYMRLIKMKNHIIIIGGGLTGETIAKMLKERKQDYIIIEKDIERIRKLRKEKIKCLYGEGIKKEELEKAKINNAKKMILTLPNDEKSIVISLLAQKLNPKIIINTRVTSKSYSNMFEQIGVNKIVLPEIVAANELID